MSQNTQDADPIAIAKQAERDLNSTEAKTGQRKGASDSTTESGVDEAVRQKFPGSDVQYGSAASGAGDNRDIPLSEGGEINPVTGKLSKAGEFEGPGGPEEKRRLFAENNPGDNMVGSNVRQGGETIRPPGSTSNAAADGAGKATQ